MLITEFLLFNYWKEMLLTSFKLHHQLESFTTYFRFSDLEFLISMVVVTTSLQCKHCSEALLMSLHLLDEPVEIHVF